MEDGRRNGATPLDPDEMDGLLPSHVTTREELNSVEQENITQAMSWLERARPRDILSEGFVRQLHKEMFGQVWKWAGMFRTTDKNIGSPKEYIAAELHKLCEDARTQIEFESYPADEITYRFHHRLVQIHPFPNGNGRHARLLAEYIQKKLLNEPPFSWGGGRGILTGDIRDQYLNSLRAADKGDYSKLAKFVRS